MEYKEFICVVERKIQSILPKGVKAALHTSVKNNDNKKEGILIETPGDMASLHVYLEDFYEEFQAGKSVDEIVAGILRFYREIQLDKCKNVQPVLDYENMKDRIVIKLIHTVENKKFLEQVPYIEVLDLSIVFYVLLEADEEGTAVMQIHNDHLKRWNVSKEQIFSKALENVKRLLPAGLMTMKATLEEIMNVSGDTGEAPSQDIYDDDVMYVLTNSIRNLGAACMIYPHVLEMVGDMLGENFYILPSSIHELIIIPESKSIEQNEMDTIVREINEAQVAPEEVLSDHAYFYECKGKKLWMRDEEYMTERHMRKVRAEKVEQ